MTRSRFIRHLTLALVALFVCALPLMAKSPKKPNIIFILADDLGYGELGCYGQEKIRTPNIDKLAKEGMRFTQFYSGSHVCAPSRSTLITGQHTGHTPIRSNGGAKALSHSDVTVAEVLKGAGYVCGGFGKWGLGVEETDGRPTQQGFDQFFGFLHQVHAHFYYPYWLWKNDEKVFLPENDGKKRGRYVQDAIHEQALDFIRRNRDTNFFCYLPYILPHVELAAPAEAVKPYLGKWPETPLKDPRAGYLGSDTPYATFAGMVSYLDTQVGQVMALLKKLKIDDNTIVFFASDNGPQGGAWQGIADFFDGNGPSRGYKGEFHEGGIRVPMIVRWPGKIKKGSTSDHIAAFWDFLPTAAEIGGGKSPAEIDGLSFLPTLLGQGKQPEHKFLYWEMANGPKITQAARMQDWKFLKGPDGEIELYNLRRDISETTNVAERNPAIVKELNSLLQTARTEERPFPAEKRPGLKDYVR